MLTEVAPAGAPRGAVVVLHEVFGLTEHVVGIAERLSDAGYHAVAPNLFHRVGGGTAPHDDFKAARRLVNHLNDDLFLADMDELFTHLAGRGFAKHAIAVVGYSLGGRFAYLLATCRSLAAAVTYSGPAIVTAEVPDRFPSLVERPLITPWLGLFGGADRAVARTDITRLEAAAAAAPVPAEVICYEAGGHGFHEAGRRSYDPLMARDAWDRTLAWLTANMA